MNIVVCVKQVPSSEARIQIGADGRSIDRSSLELVVNPYDEYAIEEALRTREKFGGTVSCLTIGPAKAEETLRTCLALGADRALIVKEEALLRRRCVRDVARILAEAIRPLTPDLILFGKVSIDVENHSIGVAVAELLGLPHVSVVSKFEWVDETHLKASREIEGATEMLEVELPAVLTAEKGLNEPRYTEPARDHEGEEEADRGTHRRGHRGRPGRGRSGRGPRGRRRDSSRRPMRAEGKKLTGDAAGRRSDGPAGRCGTSGSSCRGIDGIRRTGLRGDAGRALQEERLRDRCRLARSLTGGDGGVGAAAVSAPEWPRKAAELFARGADGSPLPTTRRWRTTTRPAPSRKPLATRGRLPPSAFCSRRRRWGAIWPPASRPAGACP